ncbi:hypothetical protein RCL1_002609 [Eukaryota sp. TZLM3-RCL]
MNDLHLASYALDPYFIDHWLHDKEDVMTALLRGLEKFLQPKYVDKAVEQFYAFKTQIGVLGRSMCIQAAEENEGYKWWATYGSACKELHRVAQRLLAQVSSASACERNWSEFEAVHSKTRNRLKAQKLKKLVFIDHNEKLVKKVLSVDFTGSRIGQHSVLEEEEDEDFRTNQDNDEMTSD